MRISLQRTLFLHSVLKISQKLYFRLFPYMKHYLKYLPKLSKQDDHLLETDFLPADFETFSEMVGILFPLFILMSASIILPWHSSSIIPCTFSQFTFSAIFLIDAKYITFTTFPPTQSTIDRYRYYRPTQIYHSSLQLLHRG